MDQHPIPQDVTGFQFKLIGTMTVKQFGYVAIGAVMAVICYYLPFNSAFGILLKVFLIPIIGASGVVIAFVPIDGRPIDIMTTNFVKALFAPNQYVYKHQGRKMSFSTVTVNAQAAAAKTAQTQTQTTPRFAAEQNADKQEKLRAFLMSSQGRVKNDLDKKEASFLKSFTPVTPSPAILTTAQKPLASAPIMPVAKPAVSAPVVAPSLLAAAPAPLIAKPAASIPPVQPAPQPIQQKETSESLAQKEQQLAQQLAEAKQEEAKPQAPAEQTAAHGKVEALSMQIDAIHSQKLQLEQELEKLKSQLSEQKNQPATLAPAPVTQTAAPAVAPQPAKPAIPIQDPGFVKVVQKQQNDKRSDLPRVSDTPNVVVGIVKDPRGNVLSNILVEVKDKNGNPVRAFKTNPLGQFASATPLSPGVYTMELEDPKAQHSFDVIQITANNEIMRPIEIISHDAREALRQQLFS